jgi:hypothetical protein
VVGDCGQCCRLSLPTHMCDLRRQLSRLRPQTHRNPGLARSRTSTRQLARVGNLHIVADANVAAIHPHPWLFDENTSMVSAVSPA